MKSCIRAIGLGIAAASILLISACGGGGGSASTTKIGVFSDSPVEGLTYIIGSRTAQTNASGQFSYEEGQTVTFKVGDIVLGSATASAFVSPISLVGGATDENDTTVANLAKFLQTIDDDNDPSNGIKLTPSIHNAALGRTINFAQTDVNYDADATVANAYTALTSVSSAGVHAGVTAATAKNHLRNTLFTALSGTYSGSYSGSRSGTFSISISTSGVITGTGIETSPAPASFSVTGTVSTSGTANFASGSAGIATFTGSVNVSTGTVSGSWTSNSGTRTGTYSGHK
ncbi:hypothetical protein [Rhodoferax saidenbachensis]|uniref:Transferrin-binding protein B C-lobe/N-lobe beta barrel domain-containing protein n=1 Tax=Rhodoferax saidenbachensis TaxID=1484693 RepID=A0ABU1ZL63_9BURK|nr:hypothetical protein [Rhodoferax saidenbachensis]MDR7306289.1 hypothetical protein [Rhodoferax saidenbachensis]